MEKLKMQTADMAERNIEILGQMFPNCLTEVKNDEGKIVRAIDFDKLRQELACEVVEGAEERYQFTWPDKRAAIRLANAPTNKTLRPCREESVDFDNTENLYIEGDNLEVLKLLRENYLGKVKMIYIDPPYNTGNDFVYNDDFAQGKAEFEAQSGLFDEEGNRMADPMVQNTESNGRFHSDWLNMIYPRLKVAKDLLSDDGVIFISIDDNEVDNLKKVCDEIFGEQNFIDIFNWAKTETPENLSIKCRQIIEYVLCYQKRKDDTRFRGIQKFSQSSNGLLNQPNPIGILTFPSNIVTTKIPNCIIPAGMYGTDKYDVELLNDVEVKDGFFINQFSLKAKFKWQQSYLDAELEKGTVISIPTIKFSPAYEKLEYAPEVPTNLINNKVGVETNENAGEYQLQLFDKKVFNFPKPVSLIKYLLGFLDTNNECIVLDFFSGSSTTAEAVMQLNSESTSSKIKFIMVQIAEDLNVSLKLTTSKSQKEIIQNAIDLLNTSGKPCNICELGKERIRRAGKKIREELIVKRDNIKTELYNITGGAAFDSNPSSMSYFMTKADETKKNKATQLNKELIDLDSKIESFDTGFRVLKLDTSNMKDVYYTPAETPIQQTLGFDELVDNIKWDERTPEDLLFQVLPECNLPLSSKIEEREIHGKKVFVVEDGYLIACFDKDINESVIIAIAKEKPYYFVMCDRSIATDNVADNFDQIFNAYSKETVRRIL